MTQLNLRDYQAKALDSLREGFAAGHRTQVLVAPTGAGKTEMAIALLEAARKKGTKSAMILDRIVLCDQTSHRLAKYGIDHGVMQAGHWRFRPYENIQVCSAQTLEKRKAAPEFQLMIVDECHTVRQHTLDFIKNNPQVKVIGLTATPFTKGLGSTYENVVSPITTKDLVDQGSLVPLRVFIAKEIDMTGAKKVAGEWSQKEASERGLKIVGDVVAEWIAKTHEIFGKPVKTIIFSSGVDHATSLAREFADKGYNFISVSYKDSDDYKKEVIEDFSKPDTEINGLIATDILTKGFDVPDVLIGVSARPFSKSLSSHIQQMGRVMRPYPDKKFAVWLCLAEGSRVLTDKGLVAIDKVTLGHKIWDGTNFVTHGGAVCNGIQETITYQGLTATPGHLVHTAQGWRTFGDCAREQIRITQTGLGEHAIRLGENIRPSSFLVGRKAQEIYSRSMRMCAMWIQKFNLLVKSAIGKNQRVQSLQSAGYGISDVALQPSSGYASQMLFAVSQSVFGLWWQRRRVQILGSKGRNSVDHEQSWLARVFKYRGAFSDSDRSNRSLWSLRARKLTMAFCGVESTEQAWQSSRGTYAQIQTGLSKNSILGQHVKTFILGWNDGRSNHRTISPTIDQTQRKVWDILDAGPNNRFTCEGLLVHNCHSGNYLRFQEDWDEVFHEGVSELDDGREKAKKERTEKEKKDSKCPKCGGLWPRGANVCFHCGFVREKQNLVTVSPGKMEELGASAGKDDKQEFWSQLQYKVQFQGWSEGRAAHTYKDKFGVWPRGLHSMVKPPTMETEKFIKSRLIAFLKGKK